MKIQYYFYLFLSLMIISCNLAHSTILTVEQNVPTEAIEQVCQLTIDLDQLNQYYHEKEIPDRSPLVIQLNTFTEKIPKLYKFGLPVKIILLSEQDKQRLPYLEFTKIEFLIKTAEVNFIYPIEGIFGTVKFKKSNNKWVVTDSRIVER